MFSALDTNNSELIGIFPMQIYLHVFNFDAEDT